MTPRLASSVDVAYAVFSSYRLSGTIIHCNCPVCMKSDDAQKLSSLPLEAIGPDLLGEYTNSAHGYDRELIEPQFKYFLPRYLDLIAQCRPPSPLGLSCSLNRLAGYRESWPSHEVRAVDDFFQAFIEASIGQTRLLKWPVGYRLEFNMAEVLELIVYAGADLESALNVLDHGPDPQTALHLASMLAEISYRGNNPVFHPLDAQATRDEAACVGEWLTREQTFERIMKATEFVADANYNDIWNMAW